jgi:hypothetical protein
MTQPEPEKKKGFLDSLPKMGRLSQLVLLIGIFLVIFIGLFMLNRQLTARQTELKGTLTNLQKILATGQTPQTQYEAKLAQATADSEAAKAAYPTPDQAPEILDSLLELAAANDIDITQTAISSATASGAIGPTLTFTLGLQGQIPKFENFLLALDTKLPTSQITGLTFTTASTEQGYDTASIKINVLSYAGK